MIILKTVDAREAFDLQLIAAAHCTGWRALAQLAQRFGDRVVPSAVGKRFVLQEHVEGVLASRGTALRPR